MEMIATERRRLKVFNADNMPPKVNPRGASLCIFCRKCCGRCSWSKDLTPVKGWTAKEKRNKNGKVIGAWVGWCPEFVADDGLYKFITSDKAKENRMILSKHYFYVSELRLAVLRYHFLNNYEQRLSTP